MTASNDTVEADGKTKVGHCKKDNCDVYIGRGAGSRAMGDVEIGERGWLGNPFSLENHERDESVAKFNVAMKARLEEDEAFRSAVRELSGKTLGCWCQEVDEDGPACHGEVVAYYADQLNK